MENPTLKEIKEGVSVLNKNSGDWGVVVWVDDKTGLVAVDYGSGAPEETTAGSLRVA